jgi:hypothetical protein
MKYSWNLIKEMHCQLCDWETGVTAFKEKLYVILWWLFNDAVGIIYSRASSDRVTDEWRI